MDKLFESLLLLVDRQLQLQLIEAGQSVANRYEEAKRYAETQRLWRGIIDDLHGSAEDSTEDSTPRATEATTAHPGKTPDRPETPA
jgi:hypothetical protein